jgi:UDP-perosamine 4-acetyltransferase
MSGAGLVIIGAGGHAKPIIEALRAAGGTAICGILDADPTPRQVLGVPVIGDEAALPRLRREGIAAAFVAIGDNAVRERIGAVLAAHGFVLHSVVHPAALVSPSAAVGAGCAILARAVIGAEARIADLALVNTGAVIEHDCRIGPAAHAGPGCILAGAVRLGARSLVGAGAAIRPGIVIGADAVVGVGAAVIADVPDGARVAGVPARPVGH